MSRRMSIFMGAICTLAALSTSAWAQQDPIMGTWKTNSAKSTIPFGPPSTVMNVNTFELNGPNGMKHTSVRTDAQGQTQRMEYTVNFDGKTYPYNAPGPGRDGVTVRKINSRTYQVFYKNGGETNQINYYIVAPDGKTLTSISTGLTPDGGVYNRMMVYDKQ